MSNAAKLKAEEKFSGKLKTAKRAMTEIDLEKIKRAEHTATLRELRLAKEAADEEIKDQAKVGKSKNKSKPENMT